MDLHVAEPCSQSHIVRKPAATECVSSVHPLCSKRANSEPNGSRVVLTGPIIARHNDVLCVWYLFILIYSSETYQYQFTTTTKAFVLKLRTSRFFWGETFMFFPSVLAADLPTMPSFLRRFTSKAVKKDNVRLNEKLATSNESVKPTTDVAVRSLPQSSTDSVDDLIARINTLATKSDAVEITKIQDRLREAQYALETPYETMLRLSAGVSVSISSSLGR